MQKLIVVLGPTASGKTALATHLAGVFDGELVNADSRQVYKEMNIGTAKAVPSAKLKTKNVKLWLLDLVNPNQPFTVADYKKLAIKSINDIASRLKLPIMVGGTGLYIRSVVDNLTIPAIPVQPELRSALEKQPTEKLYERLQQCDPKTASVIDKRNKRRLVRALEVTLVSGLSFTTQQQKGGALFNVLQIGIEVPKKILSKRIEDRVEAMIASGLQDEVQGLVRRYGWNTVLSHTIGYQEWQNGGSPEEAKKMIIKNTKRYVKRQITWFKKNKTIHWIKTKNEAHALVQKFLDT